MKDYQSSVNPGCGDRDLRCFQKDHRDNLDHTQTWEIEKPPTTHHVFHPPRSICEVILAMKTRAYTWMVAHTRIGDRKY